MGILKLKVNEKKFDIKNRINPNIRGNYRLKAGMYRTKEEQEKYIEKSLKRRLP